MAGAASFAEAYARDRARFAQWAELGLRDHLAPSLRELSGYVSHLREEQALAPASGSARPMYAGYELHR